MDQPQWTDWQGRTSSARDTATPVPARALAATLHADATGAFAPGTIIPPLYLWVYFLPLVPMGEVGPDGHPKRGGFLPPVPLERRMWAGSRCTFHAPVAIGDVIERQSRIGKIAGKTGKSGAMVFVTVHHSVRNAAGLVMEEEQDIVYMAIPERFSPPPATPLPDCGWHEPAAMDPVRLFRFSAVTFNGHRIHYDRTYAVETEHYPGLVVHGPLQALLLFEAGCRHAPGRTPRRFEFRGMRPLFDFDRFGVSGKAREDGGLDLYTATADGAITMQAALHFAEASQS